MSEYTRYTASFVATGLRFAVIASLILLSGCGGGSDSDSDSDSKPPDEVIDQCPVDPLKTEEGLCGCGIPDTDTDNDGTPDCLDACPDDPGTVPDEFGFCGDTGDSAIVVEGEELLLAINGAVLSVPANALEPGTMVTLTEVDPATLDTQPNGEDETRITPIYALTFSAAQLVTENLTFALDVTPPINARWDAHLKTEGGLATEGRSDVDWSIIFGDYDLQQSLLMIELGATADRFLIAGVSANAVTANVTTGVSVEASASPVSMVARVAAADIHETNVNRPEWYAYGYAVICAPTAFNRFGNPKCNPSSLEFTGMLTDIGAKLYASDEKLTSLGFPAGIMKPISEERLAASKVEYLVYDPDNRSASTASIGGGPIRYFLVNADPNDTDIYKGHYDPVANYIWLDIDTSYENAIHELMHAVQYLEIPGAWGTDLVLEGTASAVMAFAPPSPATNGKDFRFSGSGRDWSHPLNSDMDKDAYEAAEYWLSRDPTLENLPKLYSDLGSYDIDESDYVGIDLAQKDSGSLSLVESYLDLIKSRADDQDYEHCAAETLFCTDGSCSTEISDFVSMSAHCIIYDVEFIDACEGEPAEINVALEPDSSHSNVKLIVDGVIHDSDTPVPFTSGERIWAINTSFSSIIVPNANMVFRNVSPPCGNPYIKINRQFLITSAVSAWIGDVADWKITDYYSYDDLSEQSFIRTESTTIDVEPLGLNPYSANLTSSYEGIDEVNFTSEATLSVEVSLDNESMTFNGQLNSTAMTEYNRHNDYSVMAWARAIYYLEAVGVASDLTLTWDCDLSYIKVVLSSPGAGTGIGQTLIRATNKDDGTEWQCGTQNFIIPASQEARIDIASSFFLGDLHDAINFYPGYENTGGSFEIKMQAILPEQ